MTSHQEGWKGGVKKPDAKHVRRDDEEEGGRREWKKTDTRLLHGRAGNLDEKAREGGRDGGKTCLEGS